MYYKELQLGLWKRITPCKEGDWGCSLAYPGLWIPSQSFGVFQSQIPCGSARSFSLLTSNHEDNNTTGMILSSDM